MVVSEDIELAAKTTGAVVEALAEKSGALEPAREYAAYVTSRVYYRHLPKLVERAIATAEKIERSGLPRRAYSSIPDLLLRGILEAAAGEENEGMQKRWENLLANALTENSAEVRRGFPEILNRVEPAEAAFLDEFASETDASTFRIAKRDNVPGAMQPGSLDNLVSLGLLDYIRHMPTTVGAIVDDGSGIIGVRFTELGWAFVQACREPTAAE
jgi:hypothetical protein